MLLKFTLLLSFCFVKIRFIYFRSISGRIVVAVPCTNQYRCDKCNKKVYKNKGSLIRHTKNECGILPQFNCLFCKYKSKQKSNLLRHINNVHGISTQTSRESRDTSSTIIDTVKRISCKKF